MSHPPPLLKRVRREASLVARDGDGDICHGVTRAGRYLRKNRAATSELAGAIARRTVPAMMILYLVEGARSSSRNMTSLRRRDASLKLSGI